MKYIKSISWLELFKELLAICILVPLLHNFCNAWEFLKQSTIVRYDRNCTAYDFWDWGCVMKPWNRMWYNTSNDQCKGSTEMATNVIYCFTGIVYINWESSTNMPTVTWITAPCPSCPSQYTSLECQTEYSLIPVSDVTENYCTSNFYLISPSDCPVSSWSGDTQWSALFLNNVQYAWASNIYVNISDLLDYSTTYIDSGASFVLDVDWYVADTEYLNDILTVQEYHPDSEDFTTAFVGVLTLWLPYVVVALFVVLIWKLIRKIFKS